MSNSVKMRWYINKLVVRRVVRDLLKAGYALNIDNGGDGYELPRPSTSKKEILDAMFATDDEHLAVYEKYESRNQLTPDAPPTIRWRKLGWVYFIYCNSGYDVISDHTVNLDAVLQGANKLAERWA